MVIGGIVTLIAQPQIIGRFLQEAKVQLTYDESAKVWTLKTDKDSRELANKVASFTNQARVIQSHLKEVAGDGSNPVLASVVKELDELTAKADAASDVAAASLADRQTAPGAPPSAQLAEGWMFLGKVSSPNAEAWVGRHYVQADSPAHLANGSFVVDGNVFLRAGGRAPGGPTDKGWHSHQAVIGAVKSGEIVNILSTEVTPAVDGGWALWAQVRRAPVSEPPQ